MNMNNFNVCTCIYRSLWASGIYHDHIIISFSVDFSFSVPTINHESSYAFVFQSSNYRLEKAENDLERIALFLKTG